MARTASSGTIKPRRTATPSALALVYLFSKNHESVSAGRLAMVALQLVALQFFDERLESAVNIPDGPLLAMFA